MKKIETHIYGTGTIGERGQIVIPADARAKLKIESGDKFIFIGHGPVLHMIKTSQLDHLFKKMNNNITAAIKDFENSKEEKNDKR